MGATLHRYATEAGIQVSSEIAFRVSLVNRFIIEEALSQITNMEHILNAKSLTRGNFPVAPCLPTW